MIVVIGVVIFLSCFYCGRLVIFFVCFFNFLFFLGSEAFKRSKKVRMRGKKEAGKGNKLTTITTNTNRNLTLISKILQNLSNGLLFGAKEPYMTCMNNIIEKYTDDFKAFLYKVADDDQSGKNKNQFI